jgi:hypothetical protein
MTRSAYAHSFARTAVRLVVIIAVLSMPPCLAEAGSACKPEGDSCRTDQSCCTGLCFNPTGTFGTCRLPTTRWHIGDVITFHQGDWGCSEGFTGILLNDNYTTIYGPFGGLLRVGIVGPAGFSISFTHASRVFDYLPQAGSPDPLNADLVDPTTSASGAFGGDVVALKLNIDFTDAGLMLGGSGLAFGDLTLCNFSTLPGLNGLAVREFLAIVNTLLGGGSAGFTVADLAPVTAQLNSSFVSGFVSSFAQDHLVNSACP